MANTKISDTARNAMCDALVDLVDGGATAGLLKIFAGTQPAGPGSTHAETILATLTFSDPAFGNAAAGVATASAITSDTSIDNTGTAAWFRIGDDTLTNTSAGILDGDISTVAAGTGDIQFNSTAFQTGAEASISSLTVTQPAS